MSAQNPAISRVRLKSIAFPPEHGSWGFLLEPILLGLFVAPSLAGLLFSFGVLGAFLTRHPLKIAFTDWRRGKRYARTQAAERFVLGYGALALVGVGTAVALAGFEMLLPLLLAIPLALLQLVGYTQNQGREVLPELAGAGAIAVSASSIALAGGAEMKTALALWIVLLARDIPSILYIRARLRLDKGKPVQPVPSYVSNGVAVIGMIGLALVEFVPLLSAAAITVLAARSVVGLSRYRRRIRVQMIGVLEMVYGVLVVILTAVGFA